MFVEAAQVEVEEKQSQSTIFPYSEDERHEITTKTSPTSYIPSAHRRGCGVDKQREHMELYVQKSVFKKNRVCPVEYVLSRCIRQNLVSAYKIQFYKSCILHNYFP